MISWMEVVTEKTGRIGSLWDMNSDHIRLIHETLRWKDVFCDNDKFESFQSHTVKLPVVIIITIFWSH